MIWVHCGEQREVSSTLSLVARLADHCDAGDILVTSDTKEALAALGAAPVGTNFAAPPIDTLHNVRAFLARWEPRYLIWNGGALRPALTRGVERSSIPAALINASNDGLLTRGARWLPGGARAVVSAFQLILTADGATATRLIRGGVPRDRIEATGPILEEPMPLRHDQYELAVMAEALHTRPVWYAADVVADEVAPIAAAHLAASRKNHRLLMVITPRDIAEGQTVARVLRDTGLKVGVRSDGDDPEAEHQAYVADLPDEAGLWYRLAPLSFMGGSLIGGGTACPFEPILLGSAVIHGTHKDPHSARFERLAKAEACREIRSAAELGIALGTLISPEQTARIALAGWEETTRNAATINRLVSIALERETAA